ncbi:MAG: alanine--tRNA ligase [Candidatus Microsaccharimonas sossegonensis]|uniref:alanine--tRNA ligase n=1 Tax=Candidatus Microsaccharimonas sossegonensis TaxID=2506948 RepID=A0A4Q0AHW5_9BACT|nr:MAG: alanine--tRNA ligase [Candidatus Microsaccharimonas sossegonensis]
MNAQEIRNSYLEFFKERGHVIIPRAKLVPYNDPTTLFTGSGMQPLLPYLLGEPHQDGVRLVDSQTALRAQDIEDVGDNRHTTFFEMLGNWSLGDYFKEQQIRWFFEFLTEKVGLDPHKIYVTAFIGDEAHGIPRDDEVANIWQKVFAEKGIEAKIVEVGSQADGNARGIKPGERIFFYDDGENWWSRGGGIDKTPIGDPCGPDSEVFYDFGSEHHATGYGAAHPASDSGQFMEIGNQVFMQYRRLEDGSFEPLEKQNVDFGGGLERIAAASINSPDVFKISLLWPIIEQLQKLSRKNYENNTSSMRVIADHLRAATFLAVDGVTPSNKEQGYVMRRLIRRAIRFAFDLGIEQNFLESIVPVIADMYDSDYPEVALKRDDIIAILVKEEKVFRQTLRKGINEMTKLKDNGLTGADIFTLYDTYGFPIELSTEEAFKQAITLSENWREEFDANMQAQRQRSQTAAKGTFKGGLGGQTEIHKQYHTATHLMYAALRQVLGDHVVQHGSNITEERLRFDFSHPEKMTPEQIREVEDIVNREIKKDLKISYSEYPTKVAREEMGALGQFGDRYGETVKVYQMIADNEDKPFSFEICGGPHVEHTRELIQPGDKVFKIMKEESSSAGIRRIKAVLV